MGHREVILLDGAAVVYKGSVVESVVVVFVCSSTDNLESDRSLVTCDLDVVVSVVM
jgi:hypothetical protein